MVVEVMVVGAQVLMPGFVCGTVCERDLADKPTGMAGFLLLQNRHFRHPWRSYSRRVPQTNPGSRAATTAY